MEPLFALAMETYMIEHNPNCPMPYLVRLVTPGSATLDRRPVQELTSDTIGYGKSLGEAARDAFSKRAAARTALSALHGN